MAGATDGTEQIFDLRAHRVVIHGGGLGRQGNARVKHADDAFEVAFDERRAVGTSHRADADIDMLDGPTGGTGLSLRRGFPGTRLACVANAVYPFGSCSECAPA